MRGHAFALVPSLRWHEALARLIHQKRAWPSQILAVTFTNKAAREMKNRIGMLVGGAVEGMPWLGTFHSVCVKILRRRIHAALEADIRIPTPRAP